MAERGKTGDRRQGLGNRARSMAVRALGEVSSFAHPSPAEIYGRSAQQDASTRNPLILIPGILGSRLVWKNATGEEDDYLWGGSDKAGFADPEDPKAVQKIIHPMEPGTPLHDLTDEVRSAGSLTKLRLSMLGFPIEVRAYEAILRMLGVGDYEASLQTKGSRMRAQLDYGWTALSTCFQFDYDWRRSIPENARLLARFIEQVRTFSARDARVCDPEGLKVDVVAHSMGGLMLRYYMRYGDQLLPEDGSPPKLTWAGAKNVEHAIMIGTPNAGSTMSLDKLVHGLPATPATPGYASSFLGTFPSIYQLLPRSRHRFFIDEATGEPIEDLLSIERWMKMRWGLANPAIEDHLAMMLPDVDAPARRAIALDHLAKCLRETERVQAALDLPANAPRDLALHLFAGDGARTPRHVEVGVGDQKFRNAATEFGDGTVLRSSALMDERMAEDEPGPRVVTPIRWDAVTFIPTHHLTLTRHPTFINNALYILLEKPRPTCLYRAPQAAAAPAAAQPGGRANGAATGTT
ncbi:MAG: hypothetical protein AAFX79_02815 [Planctomycetota bacterium]